MSAIAIREPELTGRIAGARESLESAAAVELRWIDNDELSVGLRDVVALEAQTAALRHAILAEADARRVAEESADTGTDAWAAKLTGTTAAVMRGGLWIARLLEEKYAATRAAFAAGSINEDQVRVIVRASERLPDVLTPEQLEDVEAALVAEAVDGLDARRLRQRARRMVERVSAELADQHEADLLREDEARAEHETWLTVQDNGDGTYSGRFLIPELHGQMLLHYLDRLRAPRRLALNQAGETIRDESIPIAGHGLSRTESLGAALVELIEHLPSDGFGPVNATLLVTIDESRLRAELGSARIAEGVHISAGEARRLACGAGIVPAVLGGRSEVLDLGRLSRVFNKAIERALALRHDTCAAEGCERPFAWCELHHLVPWSQFGETSLANGAPLCGHHHRRAHDPDYEMRVLETGEIRFRLKR